LGARFHTVGREGKGWAYLVVLVAGEGPEDDLGTWRGVAREREKATVADRGPCRYAGADVTAFQY